jgi:hypothetical protein
MTPAELLNAARATSKVAGELLLAVGVKVAV